MASNPRHQSAGPCPQGRKPTIWAQRLDHTGDTGLNVEQEVLRPISKVARRVRLSVWGASFSTYQGRLPHCNLKKEVSMRYIKIFAALGFLLSVGLASCSGGQSVIPGSLRSGTPTLSTHAGVHTMSAAPLPAGNGTCAVFDKNNPAARLLTRRPRQLPPRSRAGHAPGIREIHSATAARSPSLLCHLVSKRIRASRCGVQWPVKLAMDLKWRWAVSIRATLRTMTTKS